MYMNGVDRKSVALEIQTNSILSEFFGFCYHLFSPYADKIQNYINGLWQLQRSSTSKNMSHRKCLRCGPQFHKCVTWIKWTLNKVPTTKRSIRTWWQLQNCNNDLCPVVSFPSTEDTNVSDGGAKTKCKSDPHPENSAIKHWQRHNGSKVLSALTQPTPLVPSNCNLVVPRNLNETFGLSDGDDDEMRLWVIVSMTCETGE